MADFWGFLTRFCVSRVIPRCSDARTKKVSLSFTIISRAAATTRKFTNKMRAKVVSNTVFEFK